MIDEARDREPSAMSRAAWVFALAVTACGGAGTELPHGPAIEGGASPTASTSASAPHPTHEGAPRDLAASLVWGGGDLAADSNGYFWVIENDVARAVGWAPLHPAAGGADHCSVEISRGIVVARDSEHLSFYGAPRSPEDAKRPAAFETNGWIVGSSTRSLIVATRTEVRRLSAPNAAPTGKPIALRSTDATQIGRYPLFGGTIAAGLPDFDEDIWLTNKMIVSFEDGAVVHPSFSDYVIYDGATLAGPVEVIDPVRGDTGGDRIEVIDRANGKTRVTFDAPKHWRGTPIVFAGDHRYVVWIEDPVHPTWAIGDTKTKTVARFVDTGILPSPTNDGGAPEPNFDDDLGLLCIGTNGSRGLGYDLRCDWKVADGKVVRVPAEPAPIEAGTIVGTARNGQGLRLTAVVDGTADVPTHPRLIVHAPGADPLTITLDSKLWTTFGHCAEPLADWDGADWTSSDGRDVSTDPSRVLFVDRDHVALRRGNCAYLVDLRSDAVHRVPWYAMRFGNFIEVEPGRLLDLATDRVVELSTSASERNEIPSIGRACPP